jgi:hypothetical protein
MRSFKGLQGGRYRKPMEMPDFPATNLATGGIKHPIVPTVSQEKDVQTKS